MMFLRVVCDEMARGNFSFLILVVGIFQFVIMLITLYENRRPKL